MGKFHSIDNGKWKMTTNIFTPNSQLSTVNSQLIWLNYTT